jgi:hypothetical protein
LGPGGEFVSDVYPRSWKTLFWGQYYLRDYLRAITWRLPPDNLFPSCRTGLQCDPRRDRTPPPNQQAFLEGEPAARNGGLPRAAPDPSRGHEEMVPLHTFDKLSPAFDAPQRLAHVRRWLGDLEVSSFAVNPGHNRIEIRVRR